MTRFHRLWTLLVGEEPISTLCTLADREREATSCPSTQAIGRARKAKRAQKHAELAAYVQGLVRGAGASDPLAASLREQQAAKPKGSR